MLFVIKIKDNSSYNKYKCIGALNNDYNFMVQDIILNNNSTYSYDYMIYNKSSESIDLSIDDIDLFNWTYKEDELYWIFISDNMIFKCIAVFKNINNIKKLLSKILNIAKYYIIKGKRGEFVTFILKNNKILLNKENIEGKDWILKSNIIDNIIYTCKQNINNITIYATYEILAI